MAKAITEKTCKPCGHTWFPRKPGTPKICPECKRPFARLAVDGVRKGGE